YAAPSSSTAVKRIRQPALQLAVRFSTHHARAFVVPSHAALYVFSGAEKRVARFLLCLWRSSCDVESGGFFFYGYSAPAPCPRAARYPSRRARSGRRHRHIRALGPLEA